MSWPSVAWLDISSYSCKNQSENEKEYVAWSNGASAGISNQFFNEKKVKKCLKPLLYMSVTYYENDYKFDP